MLKLKDIYAMPGTMVPLTEYVLTDKWLPELPDLAYTVEWGTLKQLDAEGVVRVQQLAYSNFDGERSAGMYTLWFREFPVAIIHTSGRGGSENFRRWVTDAVRLFELCQYLRTKLSSEASTDLCDPELEVYPEEVFYLYGQYIGDAFGHPKEEPATGFLVLWDSVIPEVTPGLVLVTAAAQYDPMPEYIRRNESVLQRVAKVSADELARNPRVEHFSIADGMPQIYWYKQVARPENCTVLAV